MRTLPFTVAVVLSMVVLFTPESGVPTAPPGTDKIIHLLLFGLLAVTGRWAGLRLAPLLVALVAYAGISEVLQATLPIGRDGDVWDAVLDTTGVLLGLAGFALLERYRRPARERHPL